MVLKFLGMSSCVVLFAKNPVAGTVKTRLQPHLTARQAADLYRAFVLDCAESVAQSNADRKVFAFAPTGAEQALREILGPLAAPFEFVAQPEADLGGRLQAMFAYSFQHGADRTVIIGSDSPSLPPNCIDCGLEVLTAQSLVIGPCTDGGYYLIGLRKPNQSQPVDSKLFHNIDWSTNRVFAQTCAAASGLDFAVLPIWYDVDTVEDAAFLRKHLEALRHTRAKQGQRSLQQLRNLALPPA